MFPERSTGYVQGSEGPGCCEASGSERSNKRLRRSILRPRKAQAVLHLLRSEDLELLSRELGVVASTLSLWREDFLVAGQVALKGKTGKADARDEQIARLRKKVGELTMENELLQEKTQRLEAGLPLARRRSRR